MIHSEFELRDFLRADLQRAYDLLGGGVVSAGSPLIWKGLFSPRFLPVLLCRIATFFHKSRLDFVAKFVSFLNFCFFGIEIAISCEIGRGIFFPHTQGTVIGAWSIGDNVTIFQGVTLGAKELDFSFDRSKRPLIGNNVSIGAGAKVLGGIKVGNGCVIGANSVVLDSVPDHALAAGVPARIVRVQS